MSSATISASEDAKGPRKARRISRACDYCHHRSIRCRASSEGDGGRCQNCADFDQPCTYDRPVKRRGAKARLRSDTASTYDGPQQPIPQSSAGRASTSGYGRQDLTSPTSMASPQGQFTNGAGGLWRAPHVASQAVIMDLVEIYFEVIYPIFPLFHRPTFLRKVSRGEFQTDRFLFAAVMAVCALASARARDGSIFSSRWNLAQLRDPPPEAFYDIARDAIPSSMLAAADHNCMRACVVLAIYNIQNGQIRAMHQNLARYHAIVTMDRLHDEANWPRDIGIVEVEERRRLFWSVYTLDVYASIVWSGVIRYRESQCDVLYPTEIDDELFDDAGFTSSPTTTTTSSPPTIGPSPSSRDTSAIRSTSWLCGWNFTTDLYRILEHAMDNFRTRRARLQKKSFLSEIFGDRAYVSQSSVCERVLDMYRQLPQCFKETPPITFDHAHDRFGFQAANIIATVQLLRMVLFVARGATVAERCAVASEVVDAFITIPVGYLNAISSPLLHHLAGIGSLLGEIFDDPISQPEYHQVRSVLETMTQLLHNLDQGRAGAARRLRALVDRVDEYMAARRESFSSKQKPQLVSPLIVGGAGWELGTVPGVPGVSAPTDLAPSAPALSQFQLPPELMDSWSYAFDFAQPIE